MSYMLLVMEDRAQRPSRTQEEGKLLYERMLDWARDLQARGLLTAAESLKPDHDGVRVAVRGGRRLLTDGPFTEAKEMVGGFFLLTCDSREQAIALAAECPAAAWARVEVRETGPCFLG